MRQKLLSDGASELNYEIRGIVKKAEQIESLGNTIYWENIGDPVKKNLKIPAWMKSILTEIVNDDDSYSYSHSKGILETRSFLAELNNSKGGVQITSEDITFFNGLGDAIGKIYQYLLPTSRVIGPSPAYSTHSSAEAAHANHHPITYKLDPNNNWNPDLDDLYNKIKYNPGIVGILVINPDNPTGMVYPKHILEGIVAMAKEFDLFLVFDEIYLNITYNGAIAHPLATVIGDVPGISLKGTSKEFPWPGARCGWAEYYNRDKNEEFARLCQTIDNAKMIEVSSTKLPQVAIPKIMQHPEFALYRKELNEKIGRRSKIIADLLRDIPYIMFNETNGAFYNTIIFKEGTLKEGQEIKIDDPKAKAIFDQWVSGEGEQMAHDKKFVYNLLAAKHICVVPTSTFASDLLGFRVTLLEENEELLADIFGRIREGIFEYIESVS